MSASASTTLPKSMNLRRLRLATHTHTNTHKLYPIFSCLVNICNYVDDGKTKVSRRRREMHGTSNSIEQDKRNTFNIVFHLSPIRHIHTATEMIGKITAHRREKSHQQTRLELRIKLANKSYIDSILLSPLRIVFTFVVAFRDVWLILINTLFAVVSLCIGASELMFFLCAFFALFLSKFFFLLGWFVWVCSTLSCTCHFLYKLYAVPSQSSFAVVAAAVVVVVRTINISLLLRVE